MWLPSEDLDLTGTISVCRPLEFATAASRRSVPLTENVMIQFQTGDKNAPRPGSGSGS
jgi:hypothetical protein